MSEHTTPHFGSEPFPRKPLLGAAALIAATLLMVAAARVTHVGTPKAVSDADGVAVIERDLRFEDRSDGSIAVFDAHDGLQIDSVAPGTNGFVRGTLRGLARERHRESIGPETPFHLAARRDGHLILTDPATRRFVDLGSFGPTNLAAFAKMLTAKADGVQARAPGSDKPT